MEKSRKRRVLAIILAVTMLLGMVVPAAAAESGSGNTYFAIEQVDNDAVSAKHPAGASAVQVGNGTAAFNGDVHDPDEVVRVSIVMDRSSTIAAGYSTANIAANSSAMSYRQILRTEQDRVQAVIERTVLNGKKLDVVWNLTLAANLISANVRCGDIEAIEAVPGVKEVVIETQYRPDVISVGGTLEPQMAISGTMNGVQKVWGSGAGYTGAGTRIAVIDTGLDIYHQSFDPDAFMHAIEGMGGVSLMTAGDIQTVLQRLNIYQRSPELTAADLYINEKIPFGYNYIDRSLDVTHDHDGQGEHGSHVAGIAAANRFVDANGDGQYEDALDAVLVAGNAPDAQILVMKVFGQGGGAYDSDTVAAIEDAIMMECDAVNLSLGSGAAGMAAPSGAYARIMDDLVNSSTVVTISAGNNGYWAENTTYGELYADGVNFATGGFPGTFANAFTVASVDNLGMLSPIFAVNGTNYSYTERTSYDNPPISSLDTDGSGTNYPFVMVSFNAAGHDEEVLAALADAGVEIKDAVYITWRGVSSFVVKANAAYGAGAAAVIIGNNTDGSIGLDLTGYLGDIPVVSILQADADEIWSFGESEAGTITIEYIPEVENEDEPEPDPVELECRYITGAITIKKTPVISGGGYPGHYTMSSFSSFGVPGNLTLKPEITAPGGYIYSVWGSNASSDSTQTEHDQYELMSGTSMAAPQIAGLSALVQQYLKNANNGITVPDPDIISSRALTQSLLMATAAPMKDEDGFYYPVFQQGAGLANVDDAINSPVYITVDGQADGKVKAELGDDPDRDGEYTVTFTVHSLTGETVNYELSADVFTQYVYFDGYDYMMGVNTDELPATVAFSVDGRDVTEIEVSGDVTVTATITLDPDEADALDTLKNGTGFYVEAFILLEAAQGVGDGELVPALSIPVLGYYGSWTDPSMFDVGSTAEIASGEQERAPYLYKYNGNYYNFIVDRGGNLVLGLESGDPWETYLSENRGLGAYYYALIRNAGNGYVQAAVNGEVKWKSEELGNEYAAFYAPGSDAFGYYSNYQALDWNAISAAVEDGDVIKISLVRAPEYYAGENGEYDWDALGDGAYLTTTFIMDITAPTIITAAAEGDAEEGYSVTVSVEDNYFVTEIDLYGEDGETFYCSTYGDDNYKIEESVTYTFDNVAEDVYYIVVWDYANNRSTYRLFVGIEATDEADSVTISDTEINLLRGNRYQLYAQANPQTLADRSVTWSSSDSSVATVDSSGLVTAVSEGAATITAASAVDPSVTAECEVTVEILDVTVSGVLADEEGNPKFFKYNFGTGEMSILGSLNQDPVTVADVDDESFYLIGADGCLYLMDKTTGTAVSGPSDWSNVWSVAYSEDGMWYTYGPYFMGPDDPDEDASGWGYNLSSYLAYSDSSCFTTIAVYHLDEPWTDVDDGDEISGDYIIYALTDNNWVWELYIYNSVNGEYECGLYDFNFSPSDLTAEISGYDGQLYSNMIVGWDGALYVSMMTGDTNEIYRIVYDEENDEWNSALLGDVGYDVWPALLLDVTRNVSITGVKVGSAAATQVDDGRWTLQLPYGSTYPRVDEIEVTTSDPDLLPGDVIITAVDGVNGTYIISIVGTDVEVTLTVTIARYNGSTGPSTPNTDVTTENGEDGTETTATPGATVTGDFASSSVSSTMGNEIVKQAVENESDIVVIEPNMPDTVTSAEVTIPDSTLSQIGEKTDADVTVKTPAGNVTIPNEALEELGSAGGSVVVSVKAKDNNTVSVEITAGGKSVETVDGGIKAALPIGDGQVAVLVDADGNETVIQKSLVENGTAYVLLDGTATVKIVDKSKDFDDISDGYRFENAVAFVSSHGLFKGVGDGSTFSPGTNMSRAMLVTVLWRLESEAEAGAGAIKFTDIDNSAWYVEGMAWASAERIVRGTSATTFSPDDDISREQLATMLYRYAGTVGLDTSKRTSLSGFTDGTEVSSWASDAMEWAVAVGLINGKGNGILDAKGDTTRIEVAIILQRLVGLIVK